MNTMTILSRMVKDLSTRVHTISDYTGLMDDEDLEQEICADAMDYISTYTITEENYDEVKELVWNQLLTTLEAEKLQRNHQPMSDATITMSVESLEETVLRCMNDDRYREFIQKNLTPEEFDYVDAISGICDKAAYDRNDVRAYLAEFNIKLSAVEAIRLMYRMRNVMLKAKFQIE